MKWLKKIFSKEEEPEPRKEISIELEKVFPWMEKTLGQSFSEIKEEIDKMLEKVKAEQEQLVDDLEKLKNEELHNPNIPERAKTVMEGNRQAYIQQHEIFLKQVKIPEKLDYKKVSNYCEQFEQSMLALAKSTGKSHAIMSEFFLNNTKDINKTIKKMSDQVDEIKEQLKDYDIDQTANEKLFNAAEELLAKKRHKEELGKDIEMLRTKLSNSRERDQRIDKKIEEQKSSQEYKEFEKLDDEKKRIKESMEQIEKKIETLFFSISRPVKKYERIAIDDTISKYNADPVKAMIADEKADIDGALKKMAETIGEGKLEIKDAEKFKQKIEAIEKLAPVRKKYMTLKERLTEVEKKIMTITALQEIEDLKYKQEHIKNQIELVSERIKKQQGAFEKIDVKELHERLEKIMSDHFDMDIKVII